MIEVLSLGAGVQSTTVLLMSLEGELPKLDYVIFADTGWESQETYKHLEYLKTLTTVHVVQAGNIRLDIIPENSHSPVETMGGTNGRWASMPLHTQDRSTLQRGIIMRQCTKEYKIEPIQKFIRRNVLNLAKGQRAPTQPTIRQWYGISLDEMQRMSKNPNKFTVNWYPLIERRITRQSCVEWLLKRGIYAPRSACIGCPFKHNQEWRRLRDHAPDEWKDALDFDAKMRSYGGMRGDVFVHRDCVPLDQAHIDRDSPGQLLLWQDECTGMCGV